MRERIRAVIADDEPAGRRAIHLLLSKDPEIEIVGQARSGEETVHTILKSQPDLLFLDVQMPEIDGFEVLQAIGVGRVPAVVFVTAYDQFALRAFEAHALDYLLKPYDDERFAAALQRARERIRQHQQGDVDRRLLALLKEARGDRGYVQRLVVPSGQRSVFIRAEQIDWIEAERNYVRLHVGGQSYLLRENVSRIAASLDPAAFCQIHRSTIVNIDRIQAVESLSNAEYLIVLHDGTKLSSGRKYRGNLHALMGKDI